MNSQKSQLVEWPVGWIRILSVSALAAYPLGAALIRFSSLSSGTTAGYVLIVGALMATIALVTSTLQNIAWGNPDQLDEYQLRLRARATGIAYLILTILTLLATLSAGIAADAGWWAPSSFGEYNALFWGLILYAIVLPTLCLAWQSDVAEGTEG